MVDLMEKLEDLLLKVIENPQTPRPNDSTIELMIKFIEVKRKY